MSYFEVKKHVPGAVFKRVSWDEFLVPNVDIEVMVRFEGGPRWDSEDVIELGGDDFMSRMPQDHPERHLYLIKDPHLPNRLDIRSDRIEIRVLYRYHEGAYERSDDPDHVMPDEWKETPRLKALRIEYVAPVTVLYHEEIR
jgi:hypothetical protein